MTESNMTCYTKLAIALLNLENIKIEEMECYTKAWRILNEYPEVLKEGAITYLEHPECVPDIIIGNFSIKNIMNWMNCNVLEAIDFLYLYFKDPKTAEFILFSISGQDDILG